MTQRYAIKGWCPHCNDTVAGKPVDIGIGHYEYWGAKSFDTRMVVVCDECEGELEDVEEITP